MRMQGLGHKGIREVCAGIHCVCHVANACLDYLVYSWALRLARCKSDWREVGLPPSGPFYCPTPTITEGLPSRKPRYSKLLPDPT